MSYQDDSLFVAAVQQVLRDEGGSQITTDLDDPGGTTKYGISQRFLTAINFSKKAAELGEDEAIELYYHYFYKEYKIDLIAPLHPALAAKLFNFCVTAGPKPAFTCLQRALRACGVQVKEDGVMGPNTRGNIERYLLPPDNKVQVACLYVAFKCECAGYYRDLDKPRFEAGWVARAYR